MRNVFCQSLVAAAGRTGSCFLTGDLGYKALEPLREALGNRFLNAGIVLRTTGFVGRLFRVWVFGFFIVYYMYLTMLIEITPYLSTPVSWVIFWEFVEDEKRGTK